MISIVDNLISEQEATYCIQQIQDNQPIKLSEIFDGRYVYGIDFLYLLDETIIKIIKTLEIAANQFCQNIEVDWAQIVAWPKDTRHDLHYDTASQATVFTSITYLNCAYRGGETFFDDGTSISPITGRTVFFDGNKYLHGVKTINEGVRLTLPIWYKAKAKDKFI